MTDDAMLLAGYWGKANPDVPSEGGHHTVLGHSLDVAACAFVLMQSHPVLRTQFASDAALDPEVVAVTVASVCALHDIGKLDTRFQRKAPIIADRLRPRSSTTPKMSYDHGTEGFRLTEEDEAATGLFGRRVGRSALPLLRAVCGHHGALPSSDEPAPSRQNVHPALRREDAAARRSFIEIVVDFFSSEGAALPWAGAVGGPLVQRIAGLCAVADWVGSDVDHFPYRAGPVDVATYWHDARRRAEQACEAAGLLRCRVRGVGFSELFPGYKPRDVQTITESLALGEPALVIVEAEMGKGKTEAALSMAARFLGEDLADGITVALPTMATSNAMFARVVEVAPRLFDGGDRVHFALAHGRASRHPGFRRLSERSLIASDADATEASVVCARWLLNKKRVLLAQFGVGTIDQALQAALVVRHQFVRMLGLSRNVVIVDEVHAYDAYMEVLLDHLVAWLGALRVPVVLLSATLPSERRASLARAWRGSIGTDAEPPDDEPVAKERAYPLVSVTTAIGTTSHASAEERHADSRTIHLERVVRSEDDDEHTASVATRLVAAVRKGARIVWIRNTVGEAQRAFAAADAIAGELEHVLFHSRFRACDRQIIEQGVLGRFGKDGPPGGRLLIATQVVEQSLDLDFDEMHSDLAPLDLLLQRVGRLHRHQRGRPDGFEDARLAVHVPSPASVESLRFGPSQYVYDGATLWLALDTLSVRDKIWLPDDIREFVESTYHSGARARRLAAGGDALLALEAKLQHEVRGRRTNAQRCCIPPTTADVDGREVLDDDDALRAFTRDGQSATLLPLHWDGEHARALFEPESAPPWNLDANANDAWRVASAMLDQTLSIPAQQDVVGLPGTEDAAWNGWLTRFRRFADASGVVRRAVPVPLVPEGDGYVGRVLRGSTPRTARYTLSTGLALTRTEPETARE